MSSEKTDAIVLRLVPFSETSFVVTLLSRDFGKISALAKGARRPKSPFEGSLDLGCHCRVVFLKKASDSLDLLTEAKLQRRFRAANRSIEQLYSGYYVIELLRELTEEDQTNPELFDLALTTLTEIDTEQPSFDNTHLLTRFELQTLKLLGHAPTVDACACCGSNTGDEKQRIPFGLLSGGVLCDQCKRGERQIVMLSANGRRAMRTMLADDTAETLPNRRIDGEIRGLMIRYMTHHIGRPLRMQKLIGTKASG